MLGLRLVGDGHDTGGSAIGCHVAGWRNLAELSALELVDACEAEFLTVMGITVITAIIVIIQPSALVLGYCPHPVITVYIRGPINNFFYHVINIITQTSTDLRRS